jgi:hypothetical protein
MAYKARSEFVLHPTKSLAESPQSIGRLAKKNLLDIFIKGLSTLRQPMDLLHNGLRTDTFSILLYYLMPGG